MAHGPSDPSVTVDHDHVEADITDLGSYITDVTGSPLDELSDVAAHTPTKGHLLVADGTDWEALAVGSNDEVLTADSAQATGVKWAAGGGGGDVVFADTFDTFDYGTDPIEVFAHSETLAAGDIVKVEIIMLFKSDTSPDDNVTITLNFDDAASNSVTIVVDAFGTADSRVMATIDAFLFVHSTSLWSFLQDTRYHSGGTDSQAGSGHIDPRVSRGHDNGTDDLTGSTNFTLDLSGHTVTGTKELYGGVVIRKISST